VRPGALVASDEGGDVTATFDSALAKMEHQIKRYKEKIQDHRRDKPLNEIAEEQGAKPEST
jgi:putative sigma-54 modulation protein